jgi:2-amino-4-hydroxy-6-hydroxymethyldihydropteridine diphosphokinase
MTTLTARGGHTALRSPVRAYIGLGGNLGDARKQVLAALAQLRALPHTTGVAESGLYRTAPLGADGPDYINAVAAIDTRLNAPQLLQALQHLEQRAGRERPYLNAPRTLDLDVLLYGDGHIQSPTLTVPHPRWLQRAFVLVPLHDIAPERVPLHALHQVAHQAIERWL